MGEINLIHDKPVGVEQHNIAPTNASLALYYEYYEGLKWRAKDTVSLWTKQVEGSDVWNENVLGKYPNSSQTLVHLEQRTAMQWAAILIIGRELGPLLIFQNEIGKGLRPGLTSTIRLSKWMQVHLRLVNWADPLHFHYSSLFVGLWIIKRARLWASQWHQEDKISYVG